MTKIGEIKMFLNETQDELVLHVLEFEGDEARTCVPVRLQWGDALETSINLKTAGGKLEIGPIGVLTAAFGFPAKRKLFMRERLLLAWKLLWT